MQIESAMGGSYRDRAKERRSKFGDDIPPGDNYDNYNDDYRYFYISLWCINYHFSSDSLNHESFLIYVYFNNSVDRRNSQQSMV